MMFPILSSRVSEKVLGCVLFPAGVRRWFAGETALETRTCEIREARELDAVAHIAVKDVVALYRGGDCVLRPDQRRASEGIKEGDLFHPNKMHQVGSKGAPKAAWPAGDRQSFIYGLVPDASRACPLTELDQSGSHHIPHLQGYLR